MIVVSRIQRLEQRLNQRNACDNLGLEEPYLGRSDDCLKAGVHTQLPHERVEVITSGRDRDAKLLRELFGPFAPSQAAQNFEFLRRELRGRRREGLNPYLGILAVPILI